MKYSTANTQFRNNYIITERLLRKENLRDYLRVADFTVKVHMLTFGIDDDPTSH